MKTKSGVILEMKIRDGVKNLLVYTEDKESGFYFRYFPDASWNCFLKQSHETKYTALTLANAIRIIAAIMSGFPGFPERKEIH